MPEILSNSGAPRIQRLLTVALALALGACATRPVVEWSRPARADPPAVNATALAYAYLYADAARDGYRKALVEQLGEQTLLANGLVVTGALAAALALGGAHRDALAGAAVIGGTGYALGNLGLSRPRLLVYLAGVEAINCAKRAVSPFDLPAGELSGLTQALAALAQQRAITETARRAVEAALLPFLRRNQGGVDIVKSAQAAIVASTEVQRLAGDAYGAGRALEAGTRQAETELLFAVDRIDDAVLRATLETVPDLSAVPRIIGGLAGTFEQIAPGAGVGARTTAGLAAINGNPGAKSGAVEPPVALQGESLVLVQATSQLISDTATLSERGIDVSARLAGRAANWKPDAFKECGVSDLGTALRVTPQSLQISLGAEPAPRSIIVSGGNKPYLLEFEGPVPAGITLRQPLPGDRRAELTVGKEVTTPQVLTVLVMDSSSNMRLEKVTVNLIAPAPKEPAAPASPATPKKTPAAAKPGSAASAVAAGQPAASKALVDAFNAHGAKPIAGLPTAMKITAPPTVDTSGRVTVRLRCPDDLKEADKPTAAAVVKALRAQVGAPETGSATILPIVRDASGVSCLRETP